ncbi:MAG: response regulator [Thermodesulfobacteriota bacterium]
MSDKKRILFVDDDPDILSGMKRMLRFLRKQFDMKFAGGGLEALDIMARQSYDIVISDMRMPGMDGAELLKQVKKQYPNTIRMMLTGQADDESVLRTVGVVHQFLAKPCESEDLKLTLARVSVLHDLLADEQLKSMISSVDSLPSLPATYVRLQEIISDSDCSIADVGALIEEDVAMSAKVLQLVNSAFFGLFRHIDSPSRAVSLLGLETIKGLALGVQVFSKMQATSKLMPVDLLFSHCMAVGSLARKIAVAAGVEKQVADDCFIAGILHDVGKLLFLVNMAEAYDEVLNRTGPETSLHEAEIQALQADHGVVGAYLIGLWGLPGQVVEAICFHHRLEEYPMEAFTPALAIHLADTLYHQYCPGLLVGACPSLNEEVIGRVGLLEKMEEFNEIAREVFGE